MVTKHSSRLTLLSAKPPFITDIWPVLNYSAWKQHWVYYRPTDSIDIDKQHSSATKPCVIRTTYNYCSNGRLCMVFKQTKTHHKWPISALFMNVCTDVGDNKPTTSWKIHSPVTATATATILLLLLHPYCCCCCCCCYYYYYYYYYYTPCLFVINAPNVGRAWLANRSQLTIKSEGWSWSMHLSHAFVHDLCRQVLWPALQAELVTTLDTRQTLQHNVVQSQKPTDDGVYWQLQMTTQLSMNNHEKEPVRCICLWNNSKITASHRYYSSVN